MTAPGCVATTPPPLLSTCTASGVGAWSLHQKSNSCVSSTIPSLNSRFALHSPGSAQTTLPLLRLSTVLLRLSELIYLVDDKYLDSTVGIELPIAGRHGDRASVVAKLVHFR